MSYLLDTHVLIFFGCGYEDKIGNNALDILKNTDSKLAISQIFFGKWQLKSISANWKFLSV